jgi:hypothetical protein
MSPLPPKADIDSVFCDVALCHKRTFRSLPQRGQLRAPRGDRDRGNVALPRGLRASCLYRWQPRHADWRRANGELKILSLAATAQSERDRLANAIRAERT